MAISEIQDCAEDFLIRHFKTDRTRINFTHVDAERLLAEGRFEEQDGTKWDFEITGSGVLVVNVKLDRVMFEHDVIK